MRAASNDIRDLLIDNLGYINGDTIHRGKQPAEPNNCVTVYDVGGLPELDLCKFENNTASVNIRVRNASYSGCETAANAIYEYLNGLSNFTYNGLFIQSIVVINGPEHIDYDHKNRVNFIINLDIKRRI